MSSKDSTEFRVVGARLPSALVAKLDKAAKADKRTRSKTLQIILEKALGGSSTRGK